MEHTHAVHTVTLYCVHPRTVTALKFNVASAVYQNLLEHMPVPVITTLKIP